MKSTLIRVINFLSSSFFGMIFISALVCFGVIKVSAQAFQASKNLSPGQRTAGQHKITVDNGTIFVTWFHEGELFLRRSLDKGYTWQSIQTMGSGDHSNLTLDGDRAYFVFRDTDPKTGGRIIKFRRSTDKGVNFEPVQIIEIPDEVNKCNPYVAANQEKVIVFWNDCRFSPVGPMYRRSTDFGATFEDTQILPFKGNARFAQTGDFIYLVYFSHQQGVSHFLRTTDFGATFDTPFILTSSTVNEVQVVARGSNFYLVYRCHPELDVCFRRSTDFGNSFDPEINISDNPSRSSLPAIGVSGQNVVIAYVDTATGREDIFANISTDGGVSFSQGVNLSNTPSRALYPRVNIFNNFVFVGWQEYLDIIFPGGTSAVYRASSDSGSNFYPKRILFDVGLTPEINLLHNIPILTSNNIISGGVHFRRSRPLPLSKFSSLKYFQKQSQ